MRCEDGHIYERKHGDCIIQKTERLSKRAASKARKLDLLQMEAIGDDQDLGAVYNARENRFVVGSYLWNADTIADKVIEQDMTYSNMEISTSDSTLDRTNLLNVDASLSISVLGGEIDVTGAATYIKD